MANATRNQNVFPSFGVSKPLCSCAIVRLLFVQIYLCLVDGPQADERSPPSWSISLLPTLGDGARRSSRTRLPFALAISVHCRPRSGCVAGRAAAVVLHHAGAVAAAPAPRGPSCWGVGQRIRPAADEAATAAPAAGQQRPPGQPGRLGLAKHALLAIAMQHKCAALRAMQTLQLLHVCSHFSF